jgi:hypothetical protein
LESECWPLLLIQSLTSNSIASNAQDNSRGRTRQILLKRLRTYLTVSSVVSYRLLRCRVALHFAFSDWAVSSLLSVAYRQKNKHSHPHQLILHPSRPPSFLHDTVTFGRAISSLIVSSKRVPTAKDRQHLKRRAGPFLADTCTYAKPLV